MNSIIITSIFPPTEAVKLFADKTDHNLIVVGDKKTPEPWNCSNTQFVSVSEQLSSGFELAKVLPFNHYCRKMIGYLYAIKAGSKIIIDTDDDNIPHENWEFPDFSAEYDQVPSGNGFVNVYKYFTDAKIWPRGLPLSLVNSNIPVPEVNKAQCKVGVWQGLADEDPDVDAIYRLTSDEPCFFNHREPLVLGKNTICPFNSQNTAIVEELFPLLYLPTYVTFRFTDILRGLVAQPIMWEHGYQLGFTAATVVQKRNPHDYFKDFESEIPMYQHGHKVIDLISPVISAQNSVGQNLLNAYQELLKHGIVISEEMVTLEAWLKDLSVRGNY